MKKIMTALLLTCSLIIGYGQEMKVASYSFDDCSFSDKTGLNQDALLIGDAECDCGLVDQAVRLNGNTNELFLPDTLGQLFYSDFTIDFYVNLTEVFVPTALFSVQTECSFDSAIYIRYLPQTREILLEISENIGDYYPLRGDVNDVCWTRVTVSRDKLDYRLFIDNVNVDLAQVDKEIPPGKNAKIAIGSSPCVLVNDVRLDGEVDEFNLYNVSLNERQLFNNYLFPDRIVTRDTTIFSGESLQLRVGASCFDDFNWTPIETIVDGDVLDVVVRPEENTTYNLTIEDDGCLTTDDVKVFVANKDELSCDNLLLPSAFSPNGDRLNDDYGISNLFLVDDVKEFNIYDRWGGKVFTTSNPQDRWDGTNRGQDLPGGSYTYWISYTCSSKVFKKSGNFLMLK